MITSTGTLDATTAQAIADSGPDNYTYVATDSGDIISVLAIIDTSTIIVLGHAHHAPTSADKARILARELHIPIHDVATHSSKAEAAAAALAGSLGVARDDWRIRAYGDARNCFSIDASIGEAFICVTHDDRGLAVIITTRASSGRQDVTLVGDPEDIQPAVEALLFAYQDTED